MRYTIASLVVLGSCIAAHADPLSLNLPQTLDSIKADLSSGGTDDIMVLGDSLTYGSQGYLPVFTSDLKAVYGDGGGGWTGGALGVFSNNGETYGEINADNAPHQSLDGFWYDVTGQAYTYIAPTDGSAVTVYYTDHPGGGVVTPYFINNNGSNVYQASINTNSTTDSVASTTLSVPASYTNQNIYFSVPAGGDWDELGYYTSTSSPGVVIDRAANGGWGVENFLQRDYTFDGITEDISPRLVMIMLGQNDQSDTQTQYATYLQELVNRIQGDLPNAKICLISTYDNGSSGLVPIIDATEQIAEADGLGYINLYEAGGDAETEGYLQDGIHTNQAGGDYYGNMLFDAFETDGASLVPEPTSLGLCLLPMGAMLARRPRRRAAVR